MSYPITLGCLSFSVLLKSDQRVQVWSAQTNHHCNSPHQPFTSGIRATYDHYLGHLTDDGKMVVS